MAAPQNTDKTAEAIDKLANSVRVGLKYLGTGDTASQMGAIEFLGKCVSSGCKEIAMSLDNLASAIRESKGK